MTLRKASMNSIAFSVWFAFSPAFGADFIGVPRIVDGDTLAIGSTKIRLEAIGRISLAVFFAETDGHQNIGNARSNSYKGSFQTGVSEDKNGRKKWAAIKKSVVALDPKLN